MDAMEVLHDLPEEETSDFDVKAWKQRCYDAMNDDFNTPILIAQLFEAVKAIYLVRDGKQSLDAKDRLALQEAMDAFVYDILGIEKSLNEADGSDKLEGTVQLLIELRNKARANKDYQTSDEIRDALGALGIQLKDSKEGTTFSL